MIRGRGRAPRQQMCQGCVNLYSNTYIRTHRNLYCHGPSENVDVEDTEGFDVEDELEDVEDDAEEENDEGLGVDEVISDVLEIEETILGNFLPGPGCIFSSLGLLMLFQGREHLH